LTLVCHKQRRAESDYYHYNYSLHLNKVSDLKNVITIIYHVFQNKLKCISNYKISTIYKYMYLSIYKEFINDFLCLERKKHQLFDL